MKPEVLIEMARDWANIKRRQACDILGSPEAGELLADAKKFDLVVDALKALSAQAAPSQPAVPQGWKPVPVEPTQEMIDAMPPVEEIGYWAMYSAALNAAPAAPSQGAAVPLEICPTCGEDRPYTGTCGTSDSDTRALCKRKCKPSQEPVTLNLAEPFGYVGPSMIGRPPRHTSQTFLGHFDRPTDKDEPVYTLSQIRWACTTAGISIAALREKAKP